MANFLSIHILKQKIQAGSNLPAFYMNTNKKE